jgi:hypothetical protein
MERLVRESERELADEFGRLSRRIAKHRMSARRLAARLALRRAALERLRETAAD